MNLEEKKQTKKKKMKLFFLYLNSLQLSISYIFPIEILELTSWTDCQ